MIVNLTPHQINIIADDGKVVSIPPSGQVARVAQTREPRGSIDGITVTYSTFGDVEGLPDPQDGVIYVVSGLVLSAVPDRTDVFAPGEAVRDGEGRVIGARGLSCTPAYRGEYGALTLQGDE